MFARALWVGILAVVLLTRTAHCLYLDATLCALAVASQSEDRPLTDPEEADPNESGCICKGAVFTAPFSVAEPERQLTLLPPLDAACLGAREASNSQSDPDLVGVFAAPPLSAGAVRAWFGSWQI